MPNNMPGSSPRIRGKSVAYPLPRPLTGIIPAMKIGEVEMGPRIIPANTGKICGAEEHSCGRWDHPREYGENRVSAMPILLILGSSPRIRGKCNAMVPCRTNCGIIPANTGKIGPPTQPQRPRSDHPREYGENHQNEPAIPIY